MVNIMASDEDVEKDIKEMLTDIIIALNFIGVNTKHFGTKDVLLFDLSDITALYNMKVKQTGMMSDIGEKSYNFLFNLFKKHNGRTLLDVLENIYGVKVKDLIGD